MQKGIVGAASTEFNPFDFTVFNGKALFNGVDTANNLGLWTTDGTAAGRMFGKTGAPAWPGDRLMLFCRRFERSDVLAAERIAFATARSGTRS